MKKMRIAVIGCGKRKGNEEALERLHEKFAAQHSHCFHFSLYGMQAIAGKKARVFKGARIHYTPFPPNYPFLNGIAGFFNLIHAVATADLLCFTDTHWGWTFPFLRTCMMKRMVMIVPSDETSGVISPWRAACNHLALANAHAIVARTKATLEHPALTTKTNLQLIDYCAKPLCTGHASLQDSELSEPYCYCPAEDALEEDIESLLRSFAAMPTRRLLVTCDWNRSPGRQLLVKQYSRVPNIRLIPTQTRGLDAGLCKGAWLTLHLDHSMGEGLIRTAMQIGMPILAADTRRYREITENKAVYFKTPEALEEALGLCHEQKLEQSSQDLKAVFHRRFEHKTVIRRFYQLFDTQMLEMSRQQNIRHKKTKLSAFRDSLELLRKKHFLKLHTN